MSTVLLPKRNRCDSHYHLST